MSNETRMKKHHEDADQDKVIEETGR